MKSALKLKKQNKKIIGKNIGAEQVIAPKSGFTMWNLSLMHSAVTAHVRYATYTSI